MVPDTKKPVPAIVFECPRCKRDLAGKSVGECGVCDLCSYRYCVESIDGKTAIVRLEDAE